MTEAVETTETETTTTEESWLDGHEYLGEEDKQTLLKYTSQEEANKGGANAIRQVGKSVNFPDDKTSEEDRTKFNSRVAEYQGVPKEAKDYVLDRPEKLPDGMAWDDNMEAWFREKITATKMPQSAAKQLFNDYCEMKINEHNAGEDRAKASEQELRDEIKGDFEVWFGNPKDKESIGTIRQTVLFLSDKLGLDYKDKKGDPQSKLVDCLELNRNNGCHGDNVAILKVLNFVHKHIVAEGSSLAGDFNSVKTEKGKSVFDFDDMNESGGNEGDEYGIG